MHSGRLSRIRAEAQLLAEAFANAGAVPVETLALQPADIFLDLYGEDIRARAYMTHDPQSGEQMMRPDFTVPVVQMHMDGRAQGGRYTYSGPVWRKQDAVLARASETLQVGFELFDEVDAATADAEVFALFSDILAPLNLRASTGDMGIVRAAIAGLSTLEVRKSALMRHLWRPARFRQLLERFGGQVPVPAGRAALLDTSFSATAQALQDSALQIGLRDDSEILARIETLHSDADAAPLSKEEVRLLEDILAIEDDAPVALSMLREISGHLHAITPAVDLMERRLEALTARGVAVDGLWFEGSYGRTTLEYYDGFVFGFYAADHPELAVVASGGRYDALTAGLGQGRAIPAVGGVIRPEFVLAVRESGS